jgi:hypothetical protein
LCGLIGDVPASAIERSVKETVEFFLKACDGAKR